MTPSMTPPMPTRTTSRTRHRRILPAALTAAFATMACLAGSAEARDPALVGSSGDAAMVGGYPMPAASAPPTGTDNFSPDAMEREASIDDAEQLLSQVRGQLDGTTVRGTREEEKKGALKYRNEVESMVRDHWDQLGPLTRDLYSAEYGRTNPYDNSQRYRSPYGDNGQMEKDLLGATEDVQGAMQSMEDLLLPLLKDLKQGFDNSLQQNAIRRR